MQMATERYAIVANTFLYENGVQLPHVVQPSDIHILEAACRSDRLEWQGFEALYEKGKWTVYLQKSTGLKKVKTVSTLSQAWLFVNGWDE